MIRSYRDLQVYEKSYTLALELYRETRSLPSEEKYGLQSQLRRASLSIPLNIAEGYGKRESAAEFRRYLMMAKGSCNETQVLVDFCKDMEYLSEEQHAAYAQRYDELGKMLSGLIAKRAKI